MAYLDYIDKKHCGFVHELYRYASDTVGSKASFLAMSLCMNERSQINGELRDSLNINCRQLNNWFNANGGKEISPIEKPLDIPIHKRKQVYKNNKLILTMLHVGAFFFGFVIFIVRY